MSTIEQQRWAELIAAARRHRPEGKPTRGTDAQVDAAVDRARRAAIVDEIVTANRVTA